MDRVNPFVKIAIRIRPNLDENNGENAIQQSKDDCNTILDLYTGKGL